MEMSGYRRSTGVDMFHRTCPNRMDMSARILSPDHQKKKNIYKPIAGKVTKKTTTRKTTQEIQVPALFELEVANYNQRIDKETATET